MVKGIPRITIDKVSKDDLLLNGLSIDMVYDRTQ